MLRYLLGIDIGTSGTKAVLFDENGNIIAQSTAEYPLYQPQNGWAEQNPLDWWEATVKTVKDVMIKSDIDNRAVVGIGLSGQMHGLVMLDENGDILRHAIIWADQRTSQECDEINNLVGARRHIEIAANPPLTGFTASKILWVKKNQPEIYRKCRHILLPKDYIRYRMTGVFATDVSDASGMGLLDVVNRTWSKEILDKLEIDHSWVGRVHESVEVTSVLSPQAATKMKLLVGTEVVAGAGDNAAAAVGMGVVSDGKAFTTIGTSGVVYAHASDAPIDFEGRIHTFCAAVPNKWHVMGVTQAAGLSLKWFRDNFCDSEMRTACGLGVDPYYIMDKEVERVPIGANKLLFLPYLMGERTPHLDPNCRGAFFGLSAIHNKYDMMRSIMEGVAYSQRDGLEIIRGLGINPELMLVCGGGGKSKLWREMLSDVFNCPVGTTTSQEGAAFGAAILAGVGTKVYESVEKACEKLIKVETTIEPQKINTEKYEQFYRVYKSLYPALKESYKALSKI